MPTHRTFKERVLEAREILKNQLNQFGSNVDLNWPLETECYLFSKIPAELLPSPCYGFSVYFKQENRYAYWYRDTGQPNAPLLIFECDSELRKISQVD